MFRTPTVYILGAGASWHYGYPTGEDLVHRVVSLAKRVNEYCRVAIKEGGRFAAPEYVVDAQQKSCQPRSLIAGWSLLSKECTDLIERIEAVQPLVIDHFLTTHTRLRSVGKLLIAGAILECEAAWNMWGVNWNRLDASHCPEEGEIMKARRVGDQWYRYIVHKLVHGLASSKDLPNNKVRFVTFNYDESLEMHLFDALQGMDTLHKDDVRQFFADDRILHVYGRIRGQFDESRRSGQPAAVGITSADLDVVRTVSVKIVVARHS